MTTYIPLIPTTRVAFLADLEGLWQCFDELAGTLGPDDWSGKHGQHWTFADVPYHLAYFDRDVIATATPRGLRSSGKGKTLQKIEAGIFFYVERRERNRSHVNRRKQTPESSFL